MLWPQALPEGRDTPAPRPPEIGPEYAADAVRDAVVAGCGLIEDELTMVSDFNHWVQTDDAPGAHPSAALHHPGRPPRPSWTPQAPCSKPISELRGTAMSELLMLRAVFEMIIGAGGGRGLRRSARKGPQAGRPKLLSADS